MFKFLLAFILLQSSLALGQEEVKLSKEQFLLRLERNEITMQKSPFPAPLPSNQQKEFTKLMKTKYPNFREEFLFIAELRTNNIVYTIHYEFFHIGPKRCVFRAEGFDRKTKTYKPNEIDVKGEEIDMKYCEKVYGIKLN